MAQLRETEGVTVTEADTSAAVDTVRPVWEEYAAQWGAEDQLAQILELHPAA